MRILLYGDINLNLVDGSAVWLAAVAQLLGSLEGVETDLLLKADIVDGTHLPNLGVRVVRPSDAIPPERRRTFRLGGRKATEYTGINWENFPQAVAFLDRATPYDLILVRGLKACKSLVHKYDVAGRLGVYLTDIPQRVIFAKEAVYGNLHAIIKVAGVVLCQTEEFRNYIEALFPEARQRCILLPPLVPDAFYLHKAQPAETLRAPTLVYAGKFALAWGIDELFAIGEKLQASKPAIALKVFGDKIHSEPADDDFSVRTKERLKTLPYVQWHPRSPRENLASEFSGATIGYAMRHASLDESLERSTKILEYGATSLPVLLNRNRANVELLGADYPLFANNVDEACEAIRRALQDPQSLKLAGERCRAASEAHRFAKIRETLREGLFRLSGQSSEPLPQKRKVLVASHDLKFFDHLRDDVFSKSGFQLTYDSWSSQWDNEPVEGDRLLKDADIVFCEWCFHNAVWYSQRVRPDQKLFIRFHRVEIETEFPANVRIDRVTRVVFVSEHLRRQAIAKFGWPEDKTTVIPNSVDTADLNRSKSSWSHYTLGMVGILPQLKRLDLAFEVMRILLKKDSRYMLRIRGRLPWELKWLWGNTNNRPYYFETLHQIARDRTLMNAVVFDDFDSDMSRWYQQIGYILSLSDLESFHLAVAEGMASGSLPLILDREGAEDLFPGKWVFQTPLEIAHAILKCSEDSRLRETSQECKDYVSERYSIQQLSKQWQALFEILDRRLVRITKDRIGSTSARPTDSMYQLFA